jgi:hypothetical protein
MADWTTISSLATGAGTLVLAVATFAAVRSSNRSARLAEQALQENRRPVLVQSRLEDSTQKIMFVDGHWVHVEGSHAWVEHDDGNIYLALSLRNVGAGIGVLQGWHIQAGLQRTTVDHVPDNDFRLQTRDLYIPAGDTGLWQGALRDSADPHYREILRAVDRRETISIELLYTDQVGGQRTISRFNVTPFDPRDRPESDPRENWLASAGRHWYLDGAAPR